MRHVMLFLSCLFIVLGGADARAESSYAPFLPLLHDQPGWIAKDAEGDSLHFLGFRSVTVKRSYASGSLVLDVAIVAGDTARLMFEKLDGDLKSNEAGSRLERTTLSGASAIRMASEKRVGLIIRLSDNAALVVAANPGSFAPLDHFAQAFDWHAIAVAAQAER